MLGLLARKIGMIRIYDEIGEFISTTVLKVGPCVITQKKTEEKDGYGAFQVGFEELKERKVKKPIKGKFEKIKVSPKKYIKEFRADKQALDAYEIGQEIKVSDIFTVGQFTDIAGNTKGKGFAGVIKRHGFHRGPKSHGSRHHREPGSVAGTGAAKVFKGTKLPGRMGNEKMTIQNLKIIKIDAEEELLYIKGAVPGAKGSVVALSPAVKKREHSCGYIRYI